MLVQDMHRFVFETVGFDNMFVFSGVFILAVFIAIIFSKIRNKDNNVNSTSYINEDESNQPQRSKVSKIDVNPANGLPMMGDVDVLGNFYGSNDNEL